MPIMKTAYDPLAKTFHWLTALAIVVMLALGWIMTDESMASSPLQIPLYQWHKSIGITILALSVLRLAWRQISPPPRLPAAMPKWERMAAILTYMAFYTLLIAVPLTGWIIISVSGYKSFLFGLIPLPDLPVLPGLSGKEQIGAQVTEIHEMLAFVIAGLVIIHIAAALKHHFINRDNVLLRMAPDFFNRGLRKIRGET